MQTAVTLHGFASVRTSLNHGKLIQYTPMIRSRVRFQRLNDKPLIRVSLPYFRPVHHQLLNPALFCSLYSTAIVSATS